MPDAAFNPLDYAHLRVLSRPDGSPWILGVGGMGITYKAEDTRLRVPVALKVIHPARVEDPDTRRLFLREARAAARVRDPRVVSVVYLDPSETRPFYAMEFVEGVSLERWLRERSPASVGVALEFAAQIAQGLAAIHEQGIVHRDLKPANVMVAPPARAPTRAGVAQLKIIDFGLARSVALDDPMVSGHDAPDPTIGFRGTVAYASPEQCEEATDLDPRSDLYSLGCILWELLTGRPPFSGRNHREMINQQVHTAPPWREVKGLPAAVQAVLRRLLAKAREDRFHDAGEVVAALESARRLLADDEAVTALETPPGRVSAPETRSTRQITVTLPTSRLVSLAALVAVGVVLLALAGGYLFRPRTGAGIDPALRRTVAVLPFENVGAEKETEDFAEGAYQDILTSLGKVRALRVVAVKSAARPGPAGGSEARDFSRELKAGSVLAGSVRREGSRIRVTTQLREAASGRQIWSESFERELGNVFEIQSAVAREIARALEATLTPEESARIGRRLTSSPAAYELFLRARATLRPGVRTRESLAETARQFEAVVALDPDFALAHAQLSRVHGLLYLFAFDPSPERVSAMRRTAERAIELDPGLAAAHVALGRVLAYADRQYPAALREYRTALALEPGSAEAYFESGHTLRRLGRWEEALTAHRQAAELEPDEPDRLSSLGSCLNVMRRYGEALEVYRRAAELSNTAARRFNVVNAAFALSGDWPAFQAAARALLPDLPAEARGFVQTSIGDFAGALATARAGGDEELRLGTVRVPRTFVEGTLLQLLGRQEEARAAFEHALARLRPQLAQAPTNSPLRMKLALALAGIGVGAEAMAEASEAMQRAPESADAVLHRELLTEHAQVLIQSGDLAAARALVERILRLETPLTPAMLRHHPEWAALRAES